MTNTTETVEDISSLPTEYNTVLRVWQEILSPAGDLVEEPITPKWALYIVNTYPEMTFNKVELFQKTFYGLLEELGGILQEIIDGNKDCLKVADAEEDLEENRQIYLQVIEAWQVALRQRELAWDSNSTTAAEQLAAISEVDRLVFGQEGFINYLDSIKLEVTEAEQQYLTDLLNEQE